MNQNLLIWIIVGIALIIEVIMELIKFHDPLKRLKQWYSLIAMATALGMAAICHLAALFHGVWALIFVVGLMAYAIQHLFADAIIKRLKLLIENFEA